MKFGLRPDSDQWSFPIIFSLSISSDSFFFLFWLHNFIFECYGRQLLCCCCCCWLWKTSTKFSLVSPHFVSFPNSRFNATRVLSGWLNATKGSLNCQIGVIIRRQWTDERKEMPLSLKPIYPFLSFSSPLSSIWFVWFHLLPDDGTLDSSMRNETILTNNFFCFKMIRFVTLNKTTFKIIFLLCDSW